MKLSHIGVRVEQQVTLEEVLSTPVLLSNAFHQSRLGLLDIEGGLQGI